MTAGPLLSLRHYRHDLIAHSHDHPQLVFGLGGRLDFEVDGRGGRVARQDLMVVPAGAHHTCGSREGSDCLGWANKRSSIGSKNASGKLS